LVWIARVGGVVEGVDGYADGQGAMQWKLLGLIRLLHAQGPDVSHSAAGRVAAEAVWVPTALLPRFGVTWQAADAHHLTASYRLDDVELEAHYTWMTTLGCGRSPSTVGRPGEPRDLRLSPLRARADPLLDLRRRHDSQRRSGRVVLRNRPLERGRVLPV